MAREAPPDSRDRLHAGLALLPSEPGTIIITVKQIENKGDETVVHLEEKTTADISKDPKKHILDERTINSTITCSKTKFEISPDSFFFSGEPVCAKTSGRSPGARRISPRMASSNADSRYCPPVLIRRKSSTS